MAKRRKVKKRGIGILCLLIIMVIVGFSLMNYISNKKFLSEYYNAYLASDTTTVDLYNEEKIKVDSQIRGKEVLVYKNVLVDDYVKIKINDQIYYVEQDYLTEEKQSIVQEKEVYVRTSYNLKESIDSSHLLSLCNKGDKLTIVGYDYLNSDGTVNMYKVETDNKETGYFYKKYTVSTHEESLLNYDSEGIYKIHASKKDSYGGGDGASLDYYPVIKPTFEDNPMPENVYSLYLNGTKEVISNVSKYIEYAKTTKINAFVVDIKDSGVTAYASPLMKEVSPTSYKKALNSLESYQNAIKEIKNAGFYVIGRITTFKDTYFVSDHKEIAISNNDGSPMLHQKSYWPSAYSRNVWEYNVNLAKEAVELMGFNEIQFDYVRFPDGLRTKEKNKQVDYKNEYSETKAQAIQRFLMYVTNELHELNVYVSADVFGESSWGYVPSYGQYWPSISNVVDVISAMPYTDHFGNSYGGHSNPWEYPYDTMKTWGLTAVARQKEIPTPAIARTWITAYNTPYWGAYVTYNGDKLTSQIEALYDVGLKGGYMTWNSASSLSKYQKQQSAFTKEYE